MRYLFRLYCGPHYGVSYNFRVCLTASYIWIRIIFQCNLVERKRVFLSSEFWKTVKYVVT